jgi:hypothetical protein
MTKNYAQISFNFLLVPIVTVFLLFNFKEVLLKIKMPRTKPTKSIGVYGKYDIPPEQAVETFVESKLLNKIFM